MYISIHLSAAYYLQCFLSLIFVLLLFLLFRWYHGADHRKANRDRQHNTIRYQIKENTWSTSQKLVLPGKIVHDCASQSQVSSKS